MRNAEKNVTLDGVLYLVGTPIGNLADISERAKKVLSDVSFVAAEDTRVAGKLLSVLGIKKELISYFEHNKAQKGEEIVRRLSFGESCALITDAGMPAISDPGEDIVRLCAEAGITVTAVPGPCAAVTALALSGLSTEKFFFEGFLPRQNKEKRARLELIAVIPASIILYEAPHRIKSTLTELLEALGNRKCALCRELTKLNEEIIRTDLEGAVRLYESTEPRGEYVIIIEGTSAYSAKAISQRDSLCALNPEEHVAFYENEGKKRMDAIKAAANDRGLSKSELYSILNERKNNG